MRSETSVKSPLNESFDFFANAENLDLITPSWLHFKMITSPPIEMSNGSQIKYRLRIHRIPVFWLSEIGSWDPPFRFADRQVSGPFKYWNHFHHFSDSPSGGTLITDKVEYRVPFGKLVHSSFVGKDLMKIFEYRNQQVDKMLS